ncbi:MAG TPA: hypothetical protein VLU41_04365, partial [Ideonella sp.]|nr:hypothetical protein [Ideonella sp.]
MVSRPAPPRGATAWLLGVTLTLLLAALLALALAFERTPRVPASEDVSPADIDRAVALVRQHDPRYAPPGQLQGAVLNERDLDLLVRYAARRWLAAAARVRLQPGRLLVQASVAAPDGHWLNVDAGLRQTAAGLPEVDRLRVGRLPLPSALALPLLRVVAARHGIDTDALLAADPIERVVFEPGRLVVSYRIAPDASRRLRAALVTPADRERLRVYNDRLAALTQSFEGEDVSLARLLPPLFALAAARSAAGGHAVEENRAALLTLALYANRLPLGLMVPAAYDWPRPRALTVRLNQRPDTPLHFLVSAVIAAEAGTPLADAAGLWKELSDARGGGTGFSFN